MSTQVTNEKEARYQIVSLMYERRFDEAEAALTTFSRSGLISPNNAALYRVLLDASNKNHGPNDSLHSLRAV